MFRVILLLGSRYLVFQSVFLCTLHYFSLFSATFGTLKVIKVFTDMLVTVVNIYKICKEDKEIQIYRVTSLCQGHSAT